MNTHSKLREVAAAVMHYKTLKGRNGMHFYEPYSKQVDFHASGREYAERCFGAGNQLGKTYSGANEAAYHATGVYPNWWQGARFTKHNVGWVTGESNELIRDTVQKLLLGRIQIDSEVGTGSIPKERIIKIVKATGITDVVDHAKIKHIDGGTSLIFFKSREKGRAKLQGETIDWVWHDEEPPEDIYSECLTRTNNGQNGQFSFMTFTPLKGMTTVVNQFYSEPSKYQALTMMTIEDVDHYTREEKDQIIESYPEHEREARSKGIPILGSGRIYPVSESQITVEPFKIPDWWRRIKGIDFGWDHPASCAFMAYDPENDVVYVYNGFKARKKTISELCILINKLHKWSPVAWPHDGLQHDRKSGKTFANLYADEEVNMLGRQASFKDGGNAVEPGIADILDRMRTGRFKVFSTCTDFFEEFRLYHRKDGKIVKERDDFLDAVRYAVMMLRYATTEPSDDYEQEHNESYW